MPTILPYAAQPPAARSIARLLKIAVLGIGVACFGFAGLLVMGRISINGDTVPALYGTPLAPANIGNNNDFRWAISSEMTYYIWASILIGLFLLGQWFFLLPRGEWRIHLTQSPRPLKRAAIAAGAIAALLLIGFLATLMDFGHLWQKWSFPQDAQNTSQSAQDFRPLWLIMLAIWLVWAVVFYRYFRSATDGYSAFTRVFRGLLSGTVLELLVAGPVHAFHTDPENCYCARGSYTGLVFGGAAAVWLFGPGVFLLFLRENIRRGPLLDRSDTPTSDSLKPS